MTARRFTLGSSEGPFGRGQDLRTPSTSSRKSQCIRLAACCWTTKTRFASSLVGPEGPGSGVTQSLGDKRRIDGLSVLQEDITEQASELVDLTGVWQQVNGPAGEVGVAVCRLAVAGLASLRGIDAEIAD